MRGGATTVSSQNEIHLHHGRRRVVLTERQPSADIVNSTKLSSEQFEKLLARIKLLIGSLLSVVMTTLVGTLLSLGLNTEIK